MRNWQYKEAMFLDFFMWHFFSPFTLLGMIKRSFLPLGAASLQRSEHGPLGARKRSRASSFFSINLFTSCMKRVPPGQPAWKLWNQKHSRHSLSMVGDGAGSPTKASPRLFELLWIALYFSMGVSKHALISGVNIMYSNISCIYIYIFYYFLK